MRIAVHQPNLLPRLKVLQKIAAAEVWVVLDSVQYNHREWQNRTRIVALHHDTPSHWLSVPVHRPQGQQTLIKDVTLVDPGFAAQLMKRTLRHSFRRAPHWSAIEALFGAVDSAVETGTLTRLCVETTCALLDIVGHHPAVTLASSLPVNGHASPLMAAICRHFDADEYLADSGARAYLRRADFEGIRVLWQQWREPAESWPGITSWRNVSGTNYLCREGPEQFGQHVTCAEFAADQVSAVAGPRE